MTTLTLNQELNGIEIKFDAKPLQATLDGLKKLGFRWHRQKKLWYAKQTPERLELAKAITTGEEYAEQIRKEEPKKTKPEPINKYGVKVGDVFYDSWGYEQTNIDFYQVIHHLFYLIKSIIRIYPLFFAHIPCDFFKSFLVSFACGIYRITERTVHNLLILHHVLNKRLWILKRLNYIH